MSKGPRQYTVIKVVRMTVEDAEHLKKASEAEKCSESECVRRLIRGVVVND